MPLRVAVYVSPEDTSASLCTKLLWKNYKPAAQRWKLFGMPTVSRIVIGLVGIVLVLTVAACGQAQAHTTVPADSSQARATIVATPTAPGAGDVVWGRVPYCNCLAESATANVTTALKRADLIVNLQELSPSDGWLYFAVTFDAHATPLAQVRTAMVAGGAELLDGPP